MSKLDEMFTCTELGQGFKPIKKSKEMSKDRMPEVGDVWINTENKEKFVILDYISIGRDFVGFNQQTKNIRLFDALDDMPKRFKYLGKSKANIDDLFKTENEQ